MPPLDAYKSHIYGANEGRLRTKWQELRTTRYSITQRRIKWREFGHALAAEMAHYTATLPLSNIVIYLLMDDDGFGDAKMNLLLQQWKQLLQDDK
ncbi:unnamed protein product [Dibothriocephalus latus]|uniref:Uncharacterized protein n=1 Tax=Dibothriocephalus latus TaxID=60516 RepID=A0A3P6Q0E6_DIBLA|nr:unnamed protein product [Dibothriocephalus latus]